MRRAQESYKIRPRCLHTIFACYTTQGRLIWASMNKPQNKAQNFMNIKPAGDD